MGATIFWEPVNPTRESLGVSSRSAFIDSLNAVWEFVVLAGTRWEISQAHIPILRGMSATYGAGLDNPYEKIIELLTRYEKIRIEAVY